MIGNLQIKDVYWVRLSTASMLSELVKIGEIERERKSEKEYKRGEERENYYKTIAIYNAVTV